MNGSWAGTFTTLDPSLTFVLSLQSELSRRIRITTFFSSSEYNTGASDCMSSIDTAPSKPILIEAPGRRTTGEVFDFPDKLHVRKERRKNKRRSGVRLTIQKGE